MTSPPARRKRRTDPLPGQAPVPPYTRSTPGIFRDCATVTDRRGKQWRYSEPADVWGLVVEDLGGSVAPHSARSYARLYDEFGPLIMDPQP